MPIESLNGINQISGLTDPANSTNNQQAASATESFGQMLGDAITSLSQKEVAANQAITALAAGEDIELHQVMLAMEEADVSFRLAVQVRNKLVEAYQEVMRMQV